MADGSAADDAPPSRAGVGHLALEVGHLPLGHGGALLGAAFVPGLLLLLARAREHSDAALAGSM
ncbi:hypothetical protein PF005_g12831 [Phytophthora fragariae]|uniref:Uncharacterized protein n=1 Tax=Phytophthora fragariae TaxID=53985 RepID=A0A6A3XT00_9STRA|nr:hypothetical protein PF003_g17067 [Phytophthora fragariae]KAE8936010.1 hypothetical protein PF009_g14052 [Phytophthora fragariae]KAE9006005.1 hypothetical protein PF011_g11786 [Phytophthora fragariae]KAE9106011.1 hypothetical protein PF010_g12779 [Phytophthora fragariae]KAE9107142.1 hypothetical protein PF007_g13142 [Phytophthora fragariae]